MKKQSAANLFFSMFLRAIVIILGIIIFVLSIVVAGKAISRSRAKQGQTTVNDSILTEVEGRDDLLYNTTEAQTTQETVEDVPEDVTSSTDKRILVLNSTETVGLAGRWCERLAGEGYTNTEKSDYSTPLTNTKIVSTTEGVGRDLLRFFKDASYEVGTVTEGTLEDTQYYDIVVIIGSEDDDSK